MTLFYSYLFPVAWISWAVYWFASSFSASTPKRVQNPVDRMFHRAELILAAALFTFPGLGYGWLGRQIMPRMNAMFLVASFLLLVGLSFAVWARVHLGKNWSGHVTLKAGHRLIRSGPYAIVRHPIYTGILAAMLGTLIAVDEYRAVLALVIATETFVRKLRIEERWLTEEFGSEYERYRREVKALVPGIV
jgi:protein-S-isoprenylcysteine O-methyltransferase Ste14